MRIGAVLWLLCCVLLVLAGCAPRVSPPAVYHAVAWQDLPGWQEDDLVPALSAFRRSCEVLQTRESWTEPCREAQALPKESTTIRRFFERRFVPWQLQQEDGSGDGLITGYYVPDIDARRTPSAQYRYPIYGRPDDLLVIDLSSVYPELGRYRLRGRIEGQRVVPYWQRSEIDGNCSPLKGDELFWVKDPVELFFLQVQGSGRVNLPDGERVMVNYADQNGHPYRSIGQLLLERHVMTRDQMSMQNIAAWARLHPQEVQALLNENPSYVFFRPLELASDTPPGALGVPLTAERSLAVDPRYVPLGTPVYLATQRPDSEQSLQRLMVAQDTGGAIKGRVRADFFWGVGDQAGSYAGRMKHNGQLWLLLPQGVAPEQNGK
ncbi:MAG: MltA domain-containing protein [Desulfuromonadaceae bacterium]|nr:MltA domain-containing protein [Desulfuromonadaceae bacterium]